MLAIDGESSNNLEQPEELGREVIVADLELTEVHEEDTEKHPGVGELDLIVGVHAPGEVRKTHHVSAHSPFPAMAATSCGMPADFVKLLIHQLTQLLSHQVQSGCRNGLDSPHGQKVRCGESQWHIPHKTPPNRGRSPRCARAPTPNSLVKHVA